MINWYNLKHPLSLCCISSRLGSLIIGIFGVIFTAFAGFTRHYGVTNFDSIISFELVFSHFNPSYEPAREEMEPGNNSSTKSGNATTAGSNLSEGNNVDEGHDMFSHPMVPAINHFFMLLNPFYRALYPTFLSYLFLSNVCLIYGAWRMCLSCLVIWLVVKVVDLVLNVAGTALFFACYTFPDRYLMSVLLMSFFLVLKLYTIWVVVDCAILLSNVCSLSADAIISLAPSINSKPVL